MIKENALVERKHARGTKTRRRNENAFEANKCPNSKCHVYGKTISGHFSKKSNWLFKLFSCNATRIKMCNMYSIRAIFKLSSLIKEMLVSK